MTSEQQPIWYLRKHDGGETHGPVPFTRIREWADSAQINPQDSLSNDRIKWTKAPMVADLHMDWLIEVPDNPLYGPTTSGALLEFLVAGEITPETRIVNCCSAETITLAETPFYPEADEGDRIAALEQELAETRRELAAARERIAMLESAAGEA
jgi:hypothetical protein